MRILIIAVLLLSTAGASLFIVRSDNSMSGPAEDDGWAQLIRVIDGDTFDVALGGRTVRVRLFGADAPERGHRCYDGATNSLRGILGRGEDRIHLESGPRAKDNGGRTLAYVWIESEGDRHLVDEEMVLAGEAEAWRRDGQHRERIVAAEGQAREGSQGCLWR